MGHNATPDRIIRRYIDVAAVETARLEKRMSIVALCAKAGIDPSAYRHMLRHGGERSRDRVIWEVAQVLSLRIADVVKFPSKGEPAHEDLPPR